MSGKPEAHPAWDRFWKYDRLSSFMSGPGAPNYAAPIADGWHAFFESLPDGAHILDLCTGNGAIAVMAVESAAAAGKCFSVTGADLADVEPTAFVSSNIAELRQVRFLAGTAAEALPLPDASVDAVASQYGIEYSDMAQSVPETARVLVPGGRLRFGIHAAEGSVAHDTRVAIAEADYLLDEIDLPGLASRCFEAMLAAERSGAPDAAAKRAAADRLTAFNAGLKATAERANQAVDRAMLANVHHVLCDAFDNRASSDLDALLGIADHLRQEIQAHRDRQAALLRSALSSSAMAELAAALGRLGMTDITLGEQRDRGALVGHTIEARRAA